MKKLILVLVAILVAGAILVPSWVLDPAGYGDRISQYARGHQLDLQIGGKVHLGLHLRPRPMVGIIMPQVRAKYQMGGSTIAVRADSMEVQVYPLAWMGGDRVADMLVLRDGTLSISGAGDASPGLLLAAAATALSRGEIKGIRGLSLERISIERDDGQAGTMVRSFKGSGFLRGHISFPVDFDVSLYGGALNLAGGILLRVFEEDGGAGMELSNIGMNVRHGDNGYSLVGVSMRLDIKGAQARLQVVQLGVDDMFLNLSAEGTHSPLRMSGTMQIQGTEMGTGLGYLGLIGDDSSLAALRNVQIDAQVRLVDEVLRLHSINGTIDDISLTGTMRWQPGSLNLDVNGRSDVEDLSVIYGPLRRIDSPIEFAVSGAVADLDRPLESTDMSVNLRVARPLWQPDNLERQICSAARLIQPRQAVYSQFPEKLDDWIAQTTLGELIASARIRDSRLNLTGMRTALGNIDVQASGGLDLHSLSYNASMELRLEQEQTSDEGCAIDAILRNRTLPVRCDGTLGRGAPRCGLDQEFLTRLFSNRPGRTR